MWHASDKIEEDAPSDTELKEIVERGLFRPTEEERIAYWFARFLSIRRALWEVIEEVYASAEGTLNKIESANDWKKFVIGYSAACLLIRNDRLLLFRIANTSLVQRKLNEKFTEYRIPKKQYTAIFSAYVDSRDAIRILNAMRAASANRQQLEQLHNDETVGFLVRELDLFESWLDPSARNYLRWLVSYISHKFRRKGIVTWSRSLAKLLESAGRTASQLNLPLEKRVTDAIRRQTQLLLQPGDVLVTRHDTAATNLFLPGFWPHAALYVGTETERTHLGISIQEEQQALWKNQVCVLEALKDGVRFRTLDETLAVDNFVILRPTLSAESLVSAIERVIRHEGKPYNFDFDFFNSERLVCTEVIYRAFDGLEEFDFPLAQRAGRYTLSAEDILDYAYTQNNLSVIGVFGPTATRGELVLGDAASSIVAGTYSRVIST